MFAGNFAPQGYALCDGQLMAVSQNDALFSLFGTIYGGDGRTTFGLPDLRGRIPIHMGNGAGLSQRTIGSRSGAESVTLALNNLPAHSHPFSASGNPADNKSPKQRSPAVSAESAYTSDQQNLVAMSTLAVASSGGGQSHTNMQPFQCVHFIVALFGIYPSRN